MFRNAVSNSTEIYTTYQFSIGDYFYLHDCSSDTMVPASILSISAGVLFRDDGLVRMGRPISGISFPATFKVSSVPDSSYGYKFRKISPVDYDLPFFIDNIPSIFYILEEIPIGVDYPMSPIAILN